MRTWLIVALAVLGCKTKTLPPGCEAFGPAHEAVLAHVKAARAFAEQGMASAATSEANAATFCDRMVGELLLATGYIQGFNEHRDAPPIEVPHFAVGGSVDYAVWLAQCERPSGKATFGTMSGSAHDALLAFFAELDHEIVQGFAICP